MLQQRRFDFERPYQMAAGIDDIVIAANKPEITVAIDTGAIAGEIPAVFEFYFVYILVITIGTEHRGPAWA
jgi:hypothetical protein